MEQDEQERTEGVEEGQHAETDTNSTSQQQGSEARKSNNSLLQVLDFLKNSNLDKPGYAHEILVRSGLHHPDRAINRLGLDWRLRSLGPCLAE